LILKPLFVSACAMVFAANALAQPAAPSLPTPPVERLIAAGMADTRALKITEDMTTELGARLAGSPMEARARVWAEARLRAEGFGNVRTEPFTMTYWGRVKESLTVVGRFSQPLQARAIGGSPSTPVGGIEAEVVRFANLEALRAAAPGSLAGKIAFVDDRMVVTEDGSGYGAAVAKRRECAPLAAERGGVGCLIRSAGTSHRHPHVGQGRRGEQGSAPSMALGNADADQLARLLRRERVRVRMDVQTEVIPNAQSGNVIAEIRGTERPNEIVVLGCHLDSWDLGTGALDDAVGCGIVTSAVLNARAVAGPPKRTIRIVWWGAEEVGLLGARAYAERVRPTVNTHVFAGESDSGGDTIYRFDFRFGANAQPVANAMAASLSSLGVLKGDNTANGGPDVGPLREIGVPVIDLGQDVSHYFEIHHTPDDTFDKVEPAKVRQNVAAWSIVAWWAGWTTIDFRS
jgi:carboxypeptidase Q